jgi:hypothetical protein
MALGLRLGMALGMLDGGADGAMISDTSMLSTYEMVSAHDLEKTYTAISVTLLAETSKTVFNRKVVVKSRQ